jgi:hypothetical protein
LNSIKLKYKMKIDAICSKCDVKTADYHHIGGVITCPTCYTDRDEIRKITLETINSYKGKINAIVREILASDRANIDKAITKVVTSSAFKPTIMKAIEQVNQDTERADDLDEYYFNCTILNADNRADLSRKFVDMLIKMNILDADKYCIAREDKYCRDYDYGHCNHLTTAQKCCTKNIALAKSMDSYYNGKHDEFNDIVTDAHNDNRGAYKTSKTYKPTNYFFIYYCNKADDHKNLGKHDIIINTYQVFRRTKHFK